MRNLFLILSLFALLIGCGDFDAETNFNTQAISVKHNEIRNLRGGKVSCLHCPMYFMFDADPALIAKLISEHQLQQVGTLSSDMRDIEDLVKKDASWWQLEKPEPQDKVYWIHYSPKRPELESAFRLLVIQNTKAFFITSGNFNRADFQVPDSK